MFKIIISFFLISINLYSQIQSGEVTYKFNIGYDEVLSNDKEMNNFIKNANDGANQISFTLNFNKDASLYFMNDIIENESIQLAKIFSSGNEIHYTTSYSQSKINFISSRYGDFIISYENESSWKLENQTKEIGSYQCYKATTEQVVVNSKGTFKFPIIAWYCPSIPFNFGPKGYSGLPGLILELQVRNITWGATKIELSKENKIIEKPTKGKVITLEEYNKLLSSPPTFSE
jgi:GLPGLI family protein